jgi:hypothetical protein
MACDTKLHLEGIPEGIQRAFGVSANEEVTFVRLENRRHHDGVRFTNGSQISLQELGRGVTGYLTDALTESLRPPEKGNTGAGILIGPEAHDLISSER